MGKDRNPWRFGNMDDFGANNLRWPGFGQQQNTNPMVFPANVDPFGFFQLNSALNPHSNPTNRLSGFTASEKRFLVFDRSGDQTSLIFSSEGTEFPPANPANRGLNLVGRNETHVSNGNGSGEEMHEDTEEIDALLYSDSDDDKEEEASTGHCPFETTAIGGGSTEEEVASSSVPMAATNRKRVFDEELDDPSLLDTASSAGAQRRSKRLKRERIRETVGVLRRIIPDGKGMDAATVLDKAIQYMRDLKLKTKGLALHY